MKSTLYTKYAQALIEALGEEKCKTLLQDLSAIKALYAQEEFCSLLKNPFIANEKKVKIVLETLKVEDKAISRGIEVIGNAGRLEFLPNILDEIFDIFASQHQIYHAKVYSQTKIPSLMVEKISEVLSKKIGGKIELAEVFWEKDGIKCVIEELDLEISFSQDAFVGHLKEYILDTFRKGV